ncbi:MAG: hypothetical protein IPJ79_04805 [Bacteroidetes bacterium]|nr:hypothetical protein [Bacteroidota bacterium]
MKPVKILIVVGLLLSPLFCYLEWGSNQSSFLFEVEYNLLFNNKDFAGTFTHPAILVPLLGQLLLLIAVFYKNHSYKIIVVGIVLIALLVLLVLVAGLLSKNIKIVLSTLPFISLATIYFLFAKRI